VLATTEQRDRTPSHTLSRPDSLIIDGFGPRVLGESANPSKKFAVARDVVGDAVATLDRPLQRLPVIRELGYPAAPVARDSLKRLAIPGRAELAARGAGIRPATFIGTRVQVPGPEMRP